MRNLIIILILLILPLGGVAKAKLSIENTRWFVDDNTFIQGGFFSNSLQASPYEIIFLEYGKCEYIGRLEASCTWTKNSNGVTYIINKYSSVNIEYSEKTFVGTASADGKSWKISGQLLERNVNPISKQYDRHFKECEYLGFKKGTEKMGQCVLQIKNAETQIAKANAQISSSQAQQRSAEAADTANRIVILNETLKLLNPPRQNFNCQARPFGIHTNIYCN